MKDKIIIGVDLGGTKIMTGAISVSGNVLGKPVRVPTGGNDKPAIIVRRITNSIEKVLKNLSLTTDNVLGIGIGSTGPLDIGKGIILECPQLPTMHFFPLRKTIENYFSTPVQMNNDANCLIYGETVFGIAAKKGNVVGFTLGTGIGSAIILNGKILNGSTSTAGEVWTSPYQSGIIEDYISGKGVSKIYKSLSGKNHSSKSILKLAENKDKHAINTWKEFGKHLAVPIAWAINLVNPELIVLGGSITKAHNYFMPELEKKLQKKICTSPAEKTKIFLAKLGDYAGFIGAACLILENIKINNLELQNT